MLEIVVSQIPGTGPKYLLSGRTLSLGLTKAPSSEVPSVGLPFPTITLLQLNPQGPGLPSHFTFTPVDHNLPSSHYGVADDPVVSKTLKVSPTLVLPTSSISSDHSS